MFVDAKVAWMQPSALRRAGLILLTLVLLCLLWLPVAAQSSDLSLANANLRISPEYDDPGILVILSGTFDNITNYPQAITLPVPAAARGLQTTEADGDQLLVREVKQRQGDQVTYELQKQPTFQLEYYLDREAAGNDRTVRFPWKAPYAIKNLDITVQQPARAANFTLTPKEENSSQSGDGLTSYQLKRSNLAPGDLVDLTVRYTKGDAAPSFPRNAASANANSQSDSAGNVAPAPAVASVSPDTPVMPMILIGLGIAALAAAAVYWFLERRRTAVPVSSRRNPKAQPARNMPADETRFCPKCGRAFSPGDRFCGQCGTSRRA